MDTLDDLRRRAGIGLLESTDPELGQFVDLIHRMIRKAQSMDALAEPELNKLIDRAERVIEKFATARGIQLSYRWYGRW